MNKWNYIVLSIVLLAASCNTNVQEHKKESGLSINGMMYDVVFPFSDKQDEYLVHAIPHDSSNSTTYIIDTVKKEIIGETYFFDNGPDYFEHGVARFRKEGKIGLINKKGKVMLTPKYESVGIMDGGYGIVGVNCVSEKDGEYTATECMKYGIIDSLGNEKLPLIYESIHTGLLSMSVNFESNDSIERKRTPESMNYHLFKTKTEPCNADELIIYSPFKDEFSYNQRILQSGKYVKDGYELIFYPVSNKKNPTTICYQFKGDNCGKMNGEFNLKALGKFKCIFSDIDETVNINSITPGLCMDDSCKTFCNGSWGSYKKVK